jgi:glycosyltransferase involved in cell wall biosynthesis
MNVSVVIPLFNKKDFIIRAIKSVLAQKKPVVEVIIVDDGSTDGSAELVEKKYGTRVTLHRQIHGGVSSARNKGIELSKSSYIAFLDADDYWHASFIENIIFLKNKHPEADVLCTGYEFLNNKTYTKVKNGHVPKKSGLIDNYFSACCNADLPITSSSVCIKKSLLSEIDGFPMGVKLGEDQAVWGTLACMTLIAYHADICVVYDLGASDSTSNLDNKLVLSPHIVIFQELLAQNKAPSYLIKGLQHLIHLSVMSCIKNNLIVGNKVEAMKLLITGKGLRWDLYRLIGFGLVLLPKQLTGIFYNYFRNLR